VRFFTSTLANHGTATMKWTSALWANWILDPESHVALTPTTVLCDKQSCYFLCQIATCVRHTLEPVFMYDTYEKRCSTRKGEDCGTHFRMLQFHIELIKFQQNWSKQGGTHYVLRSTNLLTVFGIRKNCQNSGRNLLLYLFVRKVIKRTAVIIEEYHCYQLHTKSYPTFFYLG
jgi:hypothetical protein